MRKELLQFVVVLVVAVTTAPRRRGIHLGLFIVGKTRGDVIIFHAHFDVVIVIKMIYSFHRKSSFFNYLQFVFVYGYAFSLNEEAEYKRGAPGRKGIPLCADIYQWEK